MKLRFAGCVYAAALLVGAATGAFAQEKTFELKLAHWVPPSHPLQKALEEWGAAVEKASGGTLHYKVYPSQQLGKAFDHYDMARDGIADLTYVNPGYQPGASRLSAPANCHSCLPMRAAARRRLTPGIANTPTAR
jgi:TRAP-type C4-dicarboxylate transport system substrate-binding protein